MGIEEAALACLSYFLGMHRALLCAGRDEWMTVFVRSGGSGPACPQCSGWSGGHHRAKDGRDVLGRFGKGPLRPSLEQGRDAPPSKQVLAT